MWNFLLVTISLASIARGACLENDAIFRSEGGGCLDLRSGRIWSAAAKTGVAHAEAELFCRELSSDGKAGWRLPTDAELAAVSLDGAATKHFRFSAHHFFWAAGADGGSDAPLRHPFTPGARPSRPASAPCSRARHSVARRCASARPAAGKTPFSRRRRRAAAT